MLGLRRQTLSLYLAVVFATAAAQGQTSNPINGSAPIAGWSLELEDVVQIPNSSGSSPRLEYLTGNPTTGLAYVVDQRGPIYSFDPAATSPTPTLVLDLRTAVGSLVTGNESGVRGIAFHPDYDTTGAPGYRKMYTSFSRTGGSAPIGSPVVFDSPGGNDHHTVIGEWTLNADHTVDLGSFREMIRVEQPFGNHNSGHIGFNPTAAAGEADYGKLYIAVGDGGSGGGPFDLSQDINVTPAPYPHGKILRIDPVAARDAPYSIPTDNPFAGELNRVAEVWAYGLRNPHKFEWDSATGEMYISDIGQGTVEEISIGRSRANYGWNDREGAYVYVGNVDDLPSDHATDDFTYPVAQYDHSGTNGISGSSAIVGGPVYRGSEVPELTGVYLFADFATNPGPIFAVDVDDLIERDDFSDIANLDGGRLAPFVEAEIRDGGIDRDFRSFLRAQNNANYSRTDTRWGTDASGEVYILNKRDGTVRRISGVVDLAPGDANRDGIVDGDDRLAWLTSFGLAGDWSDANFNAGPVTDGDDFVTWQRNSEVTRLRAVPEPSTLGLGLVCLLGLRRYHCRRIDRSWSRKSSARSGS